MTEVIESENFVDDAVSIISSELTKAVESKKRLSLCGGNTPRLIYEALSKEDIDWSNLELTSRCACGFGFDRRVSKSIVLRVRVSSVMFGSGIVEL